jgi:hypothetical protein
MIVTPSGLGSIAPEVRARWMMVMPYFGATHASESPSASFMQAPFSLYAS